MKDIFESWKAGSRKMIQNDSFPKGLLVKKQKTLRIFFGGVEDFFGGKFPRSVNLKKHFDHTAHCLCWWGFWRRLLASFWLRNDPKTVVILWFLFVYSPIKLSRRRIKFDQHFPITLHQAVHNARVSPSSLVASTTTLRLQ